MKDAAVRKAIKAAGSIRKLAAIVGVKRQAVQQWTRIPIEHVRAIESATGIARDVLRPDVYCE